MNFWTIIKLLMPILIGLIPAAKDRDDCPDGICDEVEGKMLKIQSELNQPRAQGLGDFFKCVDVSKLLSLGGQLLDVILAGLNCGPENGELEESDKVPKPQ